MKYYGYNRTSTKQQHLDRGTIAIKEFCKREKIELERIYEDKQTGKNFNRPRYIVMKEDAIRSGDVLIVSEADRLGRNKADTLNELRYFKEKGVRVMMLDIPTTFADYSNMEDNVARLFLEMINNMLIEIYVTQAQAEIDKKRIQQRKGIEAKKSRGDWSNYGRPRKMQIEEFESHYAKVLSNEKKPSELIVELNLAQSTYYRYKKTVDEKMNEQKKIDM